MEYKIKSITDKTEDRIIVRKKLILKKYMAWETIQH